MINLKIHTQPDDETCGPTCLKAIYDYYNVDISLEEVIKTVERSRSGGTLAPMVGKHALQQGFEVIIYINNLTIFDPSWFDLNDKHELTKNLILKLKAQLKYKKTKNILQESLAYLEFLAVGGELRFQTINLELLRDFFAQKTPILTSLSATYLYRSARERFPQGKSIYDDVRGTPCGHFVVLCGYDEIKKLVIVADPHRANPISHDNYYKVNSNRLINAIMLGVITYDANLIIIQPKKSFACKQ